MKITIAFFAASRYWQDRTILLEAFHAWKQRLQSFAGDCRLIVDGQGVQALNADPEAALLIVPMSGAVQKDILEASGTFGSVALYAGYIQGNIEENVAKLMVKYNAAPTLMDCWAVLRKRHPRTLLALSEGELSRKLRLLTACQRFSGAKLLLIGEPEPWVVSVSRNLEDYRRLGIIVEQISQHEIAEQYEKTSEAEGLPYFEKYMGGAGACMEPTEQDVKNASRMAAALVQTLEKHQARGMAIACFNLLSLGTTSCLGVSFINDCTDYVAACEGDLDSAVTMLLLKGLTDTKLWMANPGLHANGLVNFSHCTAPIKLDGHRDCAFALRSHHESGIGASLEVDIAEGLRLTACRISGAHGTFTAQGAVTLRGEREECCRTQAYVRFDDFDRYLATALGCHQIFCFENVAEDFAQAAKWLGLSAEEE